MLHVGFAAGTAGLPPDPQQQHQQQEQEEQPGGDDDEPTVEEIRVSCGETSSAFAIVHGSIPPHLRTELERDFTPYELETIYAHVHKTIAPSVDHPAALFVFGPSAVGKSVLSSAQATLIFGSDNNAVVLDGGEFRVVHAGWNAVAVHGMENHVLHADAWKIFKSVGSKNGGSGISSKLKKRILDEAIRDRQHLIIPDCANHGRRLQLMVEQVRDAGYELHAICLWAPLSVTRARGEPRSIREGKLWSPDEYDVSTQGSLRMALRWARGLEREPQAFKTLSVWDNTVFPSQQVTLERFVELASLSHAEADAHAAASQQAQRDLQSSASASVAVAISRLRTMTAAADECGKRTSGRTSGRHDTHDAPHSWWHLHAPHLPHAPALWASSSSASTRHSGHRSASHGGGLGAPSGGASGGGAGAGGGGGEQLRPSEAEAPGVRSGSGLSTSAAQAAANGAANGVANSAANGAANAAANGAAPSAALGALGASERFSLAAFEPPTSAALGACEAAAKAAPSLSESAVPSTDSVFSRHTRLTGDLSRQPTSMRLTDDAEAEEGEMPSLATITMQQNRQRDAAARGEARAEAMRARTATRRRPRLFDHLLDQLHEPELSTRSRIGDPAWRSLRSLLPTATPASTGLPDEGTAPKGGREGRRRSQAKAMILGLIVGVLLGAVGGYAAGRLLPDAF